jgi:DinB superfamily
MITQTSTKEELLTAVDEAIGELVGLMSSLGETQVNTVPYEDSWTAGQLFNHVTKSINGMAGAMLKESEPVERDPGEKIAGLRETFLNFSTKMKSPDFIIPDDGPFQKLTSIEGLQKSFELLKANVAKANLNDLLTGLPMGEVTKLELLHFLLYHTQRHLHQAQKITEALLSK